MRTTSGHPAPIDERDTLPIRLRLRLIVALVALMAAVAAPAVGDMLTTADDPIEVAPVRWSHRV